MINVFLMGWPCLLLTINLLSSFVANPRNTHTRKQARITNEFW